MTYVLPLIFVLATVLTMFVLIRKRVLKERFTVWWAVLSLGVLVFAAWLSRLALATRPSEAPMFLALHVVFAIAFGIAIPLVWHVA